jgi:hypothetical protein
MGWLTLWLWATVHVRVICSTGNEWRWRQHRSGKYDAGNTKELISRNARPELKLSMASYLVALIGLGASMAYTGRAGDTAFRLVGYEQTELYTGLRFERDQHEWRTIVFMDKYHQFAETTPHAEGLLDWSYVTAIHLEPAKADPTLKFATIEFIDKYDQKHKKFELGLIDDKHLAELEKRYGKFLKFRSSK